jgi:DNA-binding transcriptional LysR family regulator
MLDSPRQDEDETPYGVKRRRKSNCGARNVRALRYMVEVIEAGSFAEAAKRLGVSSSTLCRSISGLEDQLGLTLFERSRSGVRLTTTGRPVIMQARRALAELAAIVDSARANGVGDAGEVRLGIRLPPVAGPLLDLLMEWREAHPRILLRFFEMSDQELRAALSERRLDAALVARHAIWPGEMSVPVYRESISAAVPDGHGLARCESLTWDLLRSQILLTQGWDNNQSARDFFASLLGGGVNFVSHSASKQSILALVAAGYGITLAVESQSRLSWPGVTFKPIKEANAWVDIDLVWPAESKDAAAGLFVAFMRDRSGRHLP